mgnify:CR=1 FL=1
MFSPNCFLIIRSFDNVIDNTILSHYTIYCRYKFIYDETVGHGFKFPPVEDLDPRITSQVMHYDSLPIRIKSRLINMFLKYRHQLLCK